jgi:hypothetical protein
VGSQQKDRARQTVKGKMGISRCMSPESGEAQTRKAARMTLARHPNLGFNSISFSLGFENLLARARLKILSKRDLIDCCSDLKSGFRILAARRNLLNTILAHACG